MTRKSGESVIRDWIDDAWARACRLRVFQGGEDGIPLSEKIPLIEVDDRRVLDAVRDLTTVGEFAGDICRCIGDMTLVLYSVDDSFVARVSLHPGRISWERSRFMNDMLTSDVPVRILLARLGVRGVSKGLLAPMISLLNLHEGEVQFRAAGDASALIARRVPSTLHEDLIKWSGEEAANLDQDLVRHMADRLMRAEGSVTLVVRQLLCWLGCTTWPAEAVAGDGLLARRILGEFEPSIVDSVSGIVDPPEVMGALILAVFSQEDIVIMGLITPTIEDLLSNYR